MKILIPVKLSDVELLEKSRIVKYIRRIPHPSGKGYKYFYQEDWKKPFKSLLDFFGIQKQKITAEYEKRNIAKKFAVNTEVFATHVLKYFMEKQKWDQLFAKKEERVKALKPVKQTTIQTAEKISDSGQIDLFKEKKEKKRTDEKLNRSLMREVWSIYNPEKAIAAEKEDKAESITEIVSNSPERLTFAYLNGILEKNHTQTIHNEKIGDILVQAGETGKQGWGIKHIIEQRYNNDNKSIDEITMMMPLIISAAKSGKVNTENKKTIEIEKDGIICIVAKQRFGKDEKWVLSGFESWNNAKEATDAIKTGIAQYSYTPEYSYFRKQVGAVIASISNIAQETGNNNKRSEAMKGNQNAKKDFIEEDVHTEEPKQTQEKTVKERFNEAKKELSKFVNVSQLSATNIEQIEDLEETIEQIKKTPITREGDHTAHIHYFGGGTDIWITEMDEDGYAYGYTVLNGDTENAEWGYQDINEIKKVKEYNLDYYFTPDTVENLKYAAYPQSFDDSDSQAYNIDREEEENGQDSVETGREELSDVLTSVRTGGIEGTGDLDVFSAESGDQRRELVQRSGESGERIGRNVQLRSKAQIKNIREQCKKLLEEKTNDQMTADDKELLRQYEGAGGLNEDEATNHGVLSEFYTPQKLVDKVWEIVDKYNANINKEVLEPAAGTGRFAENRSEKFTLNEYDPTSYRIASILHPDATVQQGAFQRMFMAGNAVKKQYTGKKFDVVVGNPPYGKYSGMEAGLGEGKGHTRYEEYFIDRGLDTLKEGGILAYVVPSSFLRGKNSKIKEEIAKKGKLLEAWRLPNGTFGTTQVGTDIIIIRKEKGNVEDFSDNKYFIDNEDMIVGSETDKMGKFGLEKFVQVPTGMTYDDALDLVQAQKVKAIQIAEKNEKNEAKEKLEVIKTDSDLVYGNIYSTNKGNGVYAGDDASGNPLFELRFGPDKGTLFTGDKNQKYEFRGRVVGYNRTGETGARSEALKGNDNAKKDIKKVKTEAKDKKIKDGDSYVVSTGVRLSSEEFNKMYNVRTDPADMPIWKHTDVDGFINMSSLNKKEVEHVEKSGNYIKHKGKYQHISMFASGDIYKKLKTVQHDKEWGLITEEEYEFQKSVLEAVKPPVRELGRFTVSPITEFADTFGVFSQGEKVSLREAFLRWIGPSWSRNKPVSEHELPEKITFQDVIDYVKKKPVRREKYDDEEASKAKAERTKELRKEAAERLFQKFLQKGLSVEDQDNLVVKYNEIHNSYVAPEYTNIPLFVDGMNSYKGEKEFKLLDRQIKGISFLCNKGSGVLVHDVGVGKTCEAIVANVSQIQTGRAKKPLIIVPKAVYKKWIKEIHQHFPDIKVNGLGNFSEKDIGKGINVEDGTISVCTYEALQKITFKEETFNEDLLRDMRDSQTAYDNNFANKKTKTKREQADADEKIKEMLGKAGKTKEGAVYWEDTGFDNITVDEFHNFKNVFAAARSFGKSELDENSPDKQVANEFGSLSTGATSDRAMKLFAISQLVQKNNSNRNVFALSATPFNNNAIEVYNLLSIVARHRLKELGIYNMHEFLARFAEVKAEWSVNSRGSIEKKQVMKSFNNLPDLQGLLREYFDKASGEEAGVIRPRKRTHLNYLELNEMQKAIIARETDRMNMATKDDKGAVLVAMNNMRMATLSPTLVSDFFGEYAKYPGFPEDPADWPKPKDIVSSSPKLTFVCDSVAETWKQKPTAGQIIYMPRGVDQYDHVKQYLVSRGMPPDSIAFMDSSISLDKKEKIQDSFNDPDGKIKVVIGSETIKEGVSLNGNSITTYNTMLGWNPTEATQVEGRAWRQGNKQGHVHIIYPLMNDSIDALMYQKYDEKASRIDALWSFTEDKLNVEEIDPQSLKFELIKDPNKRADYKIGLLKEDIQMKRRILEAQSEETHKDIEDIKNLKNTLVYWETNIQEIQKKLENGEYVYNSEETLKKYKNSRKQVTDKIKRIENDLLKTGLNTQEDINAHFEKLAKQIEALKDEEEKIKNNYDKYVEQAKIDIANSAVQAVPLRDQIVQNTNGILNDLRPMDDELKETLKKELAEKKATKEAEKKLSKGIWIGKNTGRLIWVK